MNKNWTVFLLVLIGIVAAAGLTLAALIEIVQAIVGLVVWGIIIILVYILWKTR